ncbi:hypothetical protein GCM10009555_004490 [Acrocarpospora macrocephala]
MRPPEPVPGTGDDRDFPVESELGHAPTLHEENKILVRLNPIKSAGAHKWVVADSDRTSKFLL